MATGVLPEVETRQLEVMMKDGDKIITQEEFCKITLSVYYISIIGKVKKIAENFSLCPDKYQTTRTIFTNIRDSLFFNIIVKNVSRSGAVVNMAMDEYNTGNYTPAGHFVVLQ